MSGRSRNQNLDSYAPTPAYRIIILTVCFIFLAAVLMIGGIYSWRWIHKPTSFPIHNIEVHGALTHEKPAEIVHILQTTLSGGFFSLNVSDTRQSLLALPWIENVSFRREWPSTLVVKIEEQQPIARFGKNGLLNSQGVIFYPAENTIPKNLPDLMGTNAQSTMLFNFYQTVDNLAKTIGLTVSMLRVDDEQSWDLAFSNHIHVMLGSDDALQRYTRFVKLYPKIIVPPHKVIAFVDLRYPNGFAIRYDKKSQKTRFSTLNQS